MINSTCVIGITMLFSSIYLTILKQDKTIFTDFVKLLDDEQKHKYHKIVKERITAYVMGMIIGVIMAIYYYSQKPNKKYIFCKINYYYTHY